MKRSAHSAVARETGKSARTTHGVAHNSVVKSKADAGEVVVGDARFAAVMQAARHAGLLDEKDGRIAGRVSAALVKQAKRLTGILTDTDLIEFALATIALEDHFPEAFKQARGKVVPDLPLGY
jgi:hypothetical protein